MHFIPGLNKGLNRQFISLKFLNSDLSVMAKNIVCNEN